ncbi:MAG TPA: gamma-glutamyltransferase, partial [Stellaceae bacterium]|nr:gamma-glutamyltransferase [Stellaceae bacterium]
GLGACSGLNTLAGGPHEWLAEALGERSTPAAGNGQPAAPAGDNTGTPAEPQPEAQLTTDTVQVHTQYLGSLAADDPQAVDLGRKMLQSRGTAADAAAAMGMTLTVTLPSRAGLDGGGVCLLHQGGAPTVQELDFLPPPAPGAGAQIPGVVRGMAVLQARAGVLHWQQAVGLAEKQAQTGIAITAPLLADLNAIGMSGSLKLGDVLPQRSVAATLARLRVAGATDFYTGELATRLTQAGVAAADLARWTPTWREASSQAIGDNHIFVPNGPGGQLALAAWSTLAQSSSGDLSAAFAAARAAHGTDKSVPVTSFVATDANGQAVSCAIGMGGLFGTGKLIPGLDVYGAAPADPAQFSPMVALSSTDLIAAFAGGGGQAAPVDTATAAWLVVRNGSPVDAVLSASRGSGDTVGTLPPDRVNAVSCPGGSPRNATQCVAISDPRGGGYAMSADRF